LQSHLEWAKLWNSVIGFSVDRQAPEENNPWP
jgi:hypothetical protein